jgi:hypothetical protein
MFEQNTSDESELIEKVARLFSKKIKEELTPEEFQQALEDNRNEESEGICHTHDYIDANEAMAEALEEIMGEGYCDDIPANQKKVLFWNSVWHLAHKKEYFSSSED